jgi:hypothetical protein
VWVTETALTTALNMAYMAEQLALFGIVVGVALLLAGVVHHPLAERCSAPRAGLPRRAQRPAARLRLFLRDAPVRHPAGPAWSSSPGRRG